MSSPIEVWKLQRPITTTGSYFEIYAYTQDKKKSVMVPVAEEDITLLFGDEYKVYAKARIKRGNLQIISVIEEQDW